MRVKKASASLNRHHSLIKVETKPNNAIQLQFGSVLKAHKSRPQNMLSLLENV